MFLRLRDKSSNLASRVEILSPASSSVGVGGSDLDVDIIDVDLTLSDASGFRDTILLREWFIAVLENGSTLAVVDTGLLRITIGVGIGGIAGTELLFIWVGAIEPGLSLTVVAYVVQLK